MNTRDIVNCALQMEKLDGERNYSDMLVLLDDLDKHLISTEQLETTDVVKVLYRILKSCRDEDVKKTVRSLLTKWKRGLKRENSNLVEQPGQTDLTIKTETEQESSHSSPVRSKCVQLLLSAICLSPGDHARASPLAEAVENHIHQLHKSNQTRYKTCIRSKISNLKNPKSLHLREGLLNGSLSPQAFARMSAEEMASPDLRRLREEYSARSVSERQLPQSVEGTATDKVRCRRCEGTECRVRQLSRGTLFLPSWVKQSGPDDDAMTFVTCSACGQQWYHNNWVSL